MDVKKDAGDLWPQTQFPGPQIPSGSLSCFYDLSDKMKRETSIYVSTQLSYLRISNHFKNRLHIMHTALHFHILFNWYI